jgi:type IV pilus assembly protein PilB
MATQMNPAALTGLSGVPRRLVAEGALTEMDARRALEAATKQKIPLGTFLVEHALVASARVAQAASMEFGIPLLNAQAIDISQLPLKMISEDLINKHQVLPLFKRGNRLFVGISDPTNLRALDEIKFQSNHTVEPILVSEDQLAIVIEQAFNAAGTSIEGLEDDEALERLDVDGDLDVEGGFDARGDEDKPIIRFVNKVLVDAIKRGASTFISNRTNPATVRLRMDGILRSVAAPPVKLTPRISSRLKVMSASTSRNAGCRRTAASS